MGKKKGKQDKKETKKKSFAPSVAVLVFALIFAALGLVVLFADKAEDKDYSAETTGLVVYEGEGILWDKKGTVEGRCLSTGKSARRWIEITVETDGVFETETLYAGTGYGDVGDEVVIHYDPADPSEYSIGDNSTDIIVSCTVLFIISGGLIVIAIRLFFHLNFPKENKKDPK